MIPASDVYLVPSHIRTSDPHRALSCITDHGGPSRRSCPESEPFLVSGLHHYPEPGQCSRTEPASAYTPGRCTPSHRNPWAKTHSTVDLSLPLDLSLPFVSSSASLPCKCTHFSTLPSFPLLHHMFVCCGGGLCPASERWGMVGLNLGYFHQTFCYSHILAGSLYLTCITKY